MFSTVSVEKGDIYNAITATGTLEATNTVVVGTQVSGVIEKLYADFNSVVKKRAIDRRAGQIDLAIEFGKCGSRFGKGRSQL